MNLSIKAKLIISATAIIIVTGVHAVPSVMPELKVAVINRNDIGAENSDRVKVQEKNNAITEEHHFTPQEDIHIGEVSRKYLLEHLDVLVEASRKLENAERERSIMAIRNAALEHKNELLNDQGSPAYGPADADVVVVEFFDYQCVVCAGQAKVLNDFMKSNPDVKYIFKEWPIFGQRWAASLNAAETGLQIWHQKGSEAYLSYHNAIFETGHNEGALTDADIIKAAELAGELKGNKDDSLDILSRIDVQAKTLGLRGTPGFIIMPVKGASIDNVTVIPGGADPEMLQTAVSKAKAG